MKSLRWNEVEGNTDVEEEAERPSSDGPLLSHCVFFFALQLCSCETLFFINRQIAPKFWA